MLYNSLERPISEYACPVWCPCLVKDKLTIEKFNEEHQRLLLVKSQVKMCQVHKVHIMFQICKYLG